MWRKFLFRIGVRSRLHINDLVPTDKELATLKSLDVFQRAAIIRLCEMIRLCKPNDQTRKSAEEIRDLIIDYTKDKHNLLQHEQPQPFQKRNEELAKHPLLPRYDIF